MARPIPQRIYWPGTLAEARAGLQPCIAAFIAAANRGRLITSDPLTASARLDVIAHRVLLAMSEGRAFTFWGWPLWMEVAWLNIDAHMRASDPPSLSRRIGKLQRRRSRRPGAYHLRRCRVCESWMFVKPAHRYLCGRADCHRLEGNRHERERNQVKTERDAARIALVRAEHSFAPKRTF